MTENKRRKNHTDLECVKEGYANGVAPGFPLTEQEKWEMVDKAELAYGQFLTALGVDWKNDPNSSETPRRVAKAWGNFNGTGTVAIRDSYNVSSITDNGTGDYTINYGTALNNSNYAISGITDYNESGLHRVIVYRSGLSHQYNTLGVRIQIIAQVGSSDATQDPAFASLMVLGN